MPRLQRLSCLTGGLSALLAILLGLAASPLTAAPRADLLQLVPDDVGFCLVVGDLRTQAKMFHASPWFKRFRESSLADALAKSPEIQQLKRLRVGLEKRLNVDLARLRDDIFGDAVVLAYRPGPPAKPEEEQGVLLLWARDVKLLDRLINQWNRNLKDLESRTYKETKYFRRRETGGKSSYYFLSGSVLAFSSHEAMIRDVIARARGRSTRSVLDQLRQLGADRALVALWFNPRAFDAHILEMVRSVKGPQKHPLATFLRYWKALEGGAFTLSVGKEVEIRLAIRAKADQLPDAARRFLNEATQPSEVWRLFPAHPLLAVAGRVEFKALGAFLEDFLPPPARSVFRTKVIRGVEAGLGVDVAKDVLPYLGPDWGFCMSAPASKDVIVPSMIWALRVQHGPHKTGLDRTLFNGLSSLALLGVFSYNSQGEHAAELRLRSVKQDQYEVKYLENDKEFPGGVKPAFALKDGFLVLASSPDAVEGFSRKPTAPPVTEDVPLVRVSLQGWSMYLKNRRATLVGWMAERDQISPAQAGKRFDQMLQVFELLGSIDFSQRTGGGQATWTLRIQPAVPEK